MGSINRTTSNRVTQLIEMIKKICEMIDPPSGETRQLWSDIVRRGRGGKIGPTRWASPVRLKLGPGWAIKLLARKKPGQIWPGPVWPGPPEFFLALKRLFGPTGPVFRAGWAVKILARKNQASFGPARFWSGPLLARPARLPPLPRGERP